MSKGELSILLATVIGGMIYALRNQNVKQMIWLHPEEKDKPMSSRIFLRAYRIFMLIVIPGLPIYLLLLKLTDVIDWSWLLIILPVLLIYTPIFFLFLYFISIVLHALNLLGSTIKSLFILKVK